MALFEPCSLHTDCIGKGSDPSWRGRALLSQSPCLSSCPLGSCVSSMSRRRGQGYQCQIWVAKVSQATQTPWPTPCSSPGIPCGDRISLASNVIDTYIQSPGSSPPSPSPFPERLLSRVVQELQRRVPGWVCFCRRMIPLMEVKPEDRQNQGPATPWGRRIGQSHTSLVTNWE